MIVTERKLRKLIRKILLEKGNEDLKKNFKSSREMNAHLIIIPMICDRGHRETREIFDFHKKVTEKVGTLPSGYYQHYSQFVLYKNKLNIETLIEEISNAKKDPNRPSITELDADYLRTTLDDNLPVIIRAGAGDGIGTRNKGVINIDPGNADVPQWLIHDLFHVHEVPVRSRFPDDPMTKRGYMQIPLMTTFGRDAQKKFEALTNYGVTDIDAAEKNIMNFFKANNFTPNVEQRDLYPSILSYIVMNIESRDDIKNKLPRNIDKDCIKIFDYMYHFIERYDKWLRHKKNRNKIFISTADHDIVYNDVFQDR